MDETELEEMSIDEAADAFMAAREKEAEGSETEEELEEAEVEEELEDDGDDVDEADEAGEDEDASEEEVETAEVVADKDSVVEVVVDGKATKMKVSELTRLAGQEASLTQKSQAVADRERVTESQGMYVAKLLEDRYNKAKATANKYANVDLFKASRELDAEEFDALRAAKEAADAEVTALEHEAKTFLTKVQENRAATLRSKAQVALRELPKLIPDWSDELYGKIRTYAVSQGMRTEEVNEIVDPAAIVLLHKAMQFDNAQNKKESVQKKVVKTAKATTPKAVKVVDARANKLKVKRQVAMRSGSVDDVAELFAASLK